MKFIDNINLKNIKHIVPNDITITEYYWFARGYNKAIETIMDETKSKIKRPYVVKIGTLHDFYCETFEQALRTYNIYKPFEKVSIEYNGNYC